MGEPIVEPSNTKPSLVIGMSGGSGFLIRFSSSGTKSIDLLMLRSRPLEGPSSSMIFNAAIRSSQVPQRVPSSRY